MKVLDAIKKGLDIASKNLNLVLIVFIFNAIWNIAVVPFTPETPTVLGAGVAMSPMLGILSAVFILASIFIQGGVLGSVRDAVKAGKAEVAKFVGYGKKFYLRLLMLALLIILIVAIFGFIVTMIVAASAPTQNGVLIALTTVLALAIGAAGIFAILLLFLSPYILVIEDLGVMDAVKASIEFTKKILVKILGLGALLILIGFGVGFVTGIIAGILSLAIKGKALQVLMGIVNGGVNSFIGILIASTLVTYYLAMKQGGSKEASPAA